MAGTTPEQKRFFQEQALQMGVPAEWIASFLARNPGDEHRILESYAGEAGGQGAATISAHGGTGAGVTSGPGGNLVVTGDYDAPGLPAYPPDIPPSMPGGAGGFPALFGGNGGFSLTTLLVIAAMAGAAWYLWRTR